MDNSRDVFSLRQIIIDIEGEMLPNSRDAIINEKNRIFRGFCLSCGIDAANLKSASGKYRFQPENAKFVIDLFANFDKKPVVHIRKREYEKVDYLYYKRIEDFVVSVMQFNGKGPCQIDAQLMKMRDKTEWVYREHVQQIKDIGSAAADQMYQVMKSQLNKDLEDKFFLFELAVSIFQKKIQHFINEFESMLGYFKNIRADEAMSTEPAMFQEALDGHILLATILDPEMREVKEAIEQLNLKKNLGNQEEIGKLERKKQERLAVIIEAYCKDMQKRGDLRFEPSRESAHRMSSKDVMNEFYKVHSYDSARWPDPF